MNYIHTETNPILSYFIRQLNFPIEWWKNKTILDFGGNKSNILNDAAELIDHENYYCLDVSKAGIEEGKRLYPDAHWYYYNRYNHMYNYSGQKNEPFPFSDIKFDIILSYAVFSSTSLEDMNHTINKELLPILNPGGVLMTTFLSLDNPRPLNYFLRRRLDNNEKIIAVKNTIIGLPYFYLLGNDVIITTEDELGQCRQSTILSFYKNSVIMELFPNAKINKPFVSSGQSCIILTKDVC